MVQAGGGEKKKRRIKKKGKKHYNSHTEKLAQLACMFVQGIRARGIQKYILTF
jgi:hypothetical protein